MLSACDPCDLSPDCGRGERIVDVMRRAEGFEDGFIAGAGGIGDRRELGEPRYLDGSVRDSYQQVQVYAATMKQGRMTHRIGRRKTSPRG